MRTTRSVPRASLLLFVTVALLSSVLINAPAIAVADTLLNEDEIVALTNETRAENGIPHTAVHPALQTAAAAKAEAMAARSEFAHTLRDGTTAWDHIQAAGYRYERAGENLAVHFTSESEIVDAWMRSPSHRANLLEGEFTHIGIGIARGTWKGADGYYVVQLFAKEML